LTAVENSLLVPARMLNEYVYCPRLAYLEWVHGEFRHSVDTLEGTFQHRRVDVQSGNIADLADEKRLEDTDIRARAIMLSGSKSGLIAKMDVVEIQEGSIVPIDFKHGKIPKTPERSWEPERVQLCAQGLVLQENGYNCDHGIIYYVDSKTKVLIEFDDALRERTLSMLEEFKKVAESGQIPEPLEDSPKCNRCSLAGICLPDEVNFMRKVREGIKSSPRRLVPALADKVPVYVQDQGSVLSKKGDLVQIKQKGNLLQEVRLMSISQISVFGNVQVSTQLIRELADRNIPLCYFTYGGWYKAVLSSFHHKNIELRCKQYEIAADSQHRLKAAIPFVVGKIKNCRTMLRRNNTKVSSSALAELNRLSKKARKATSLESLLGIEGAAARTYFANFGDMIKGEFGNRFEFESRNRRPPKDPVNALLSFVYGLLVKDLYIEALMVGLDPLLGFLHRTKYGKPALALDLAEEFRPIIGDSVVLTVLNGGEVGPSDFISRLGAVTLTPNGRKKVISAYERRLATEIRHPVFGYSISYRRVFEVQARLLSRWIMNEIPEYLPFSTR
jgi:CRISPR-associated protein Cas1